jgi:NADPH-dependent 2,4-dienoyl-CoA reductase/sulfur reductase-like enzyme
VEKIVIVGNGIAGLTAADSLKHAGFGGQITIIGAEKHRPYSRPALSKAAMHEVGEITAHLLPEPDHGATERLGVSAKFLNTLKNELTLSNGQVEHFDGLVIATGIHPRKLREDLDLELTFRNLEDAIALRELLKSAPDVVVIGAGVLGMELASVCQEAGCRVRVIPKRSPMFASLGEYLGNFFMAAAESKGVEFLSVQAGNVRESGGKKIVVLQDGTELETDLIITAIGDSPNTDWLEDSGLLIDGELQVDSRGRVSPNIVAAGDVASLPFPDGSRRIPLWTSAIEQAKVAANSLLLGDEAPELDFQPYFWTEQFGYALKACGNLPVSGIPQNIDGDVAREPSLMRWQNPDGTGTAVAINYRIPIPKLRALSRQAPSAENQQV